MAGLFGQAIAAFQGFFSRGFWFGSFLPVAMFAAVNLFLAWLAGFAWAAPLIALITAKDWVWAVPLGAALIVLAYALTPLVPVCRAVLDGRRLPTLVFEWLRGEAYARKNAALAQLMETGQYGVRTNTLRTLIRIRLPAARAVGEQLGATNRFIFVWFASVAVRFLEGRVASGTMPGKLTLWFVVGAASVALNTNAASRSGIVGGLEARILDSLDKADENARDRHRRLLEAFNKLPRDPQPTRAGEARNLSELYTQSVYHVEFSFLWPRVQMVIKDDDPSMKRIEAARALADFSVLSLMLAVATLGVWLPLLSFTQREPWTFLGLGLGGPLLIRFFYQLMVESQISLGEVAQGVVDRFRFDVLKMLHIKPPATLEGEREIWSTMAAIARGERPSTDIIWNAPPT